jgi:hypothetical protein
MQIECSGSILKDRLRDTFGGMLWMDIFFMTCSDLSDMRLTQYTDPKDPFPRSCKKTANCHAAGGTIIRRLSRFGEPFGAAVYTRLPVLHGEHFRYEDSDTHISYIRWECVILVESILMGHRLCVSLARIHWGQAQRAGTPGAH